MYILPFEKMHGLGNDFILLHSKHLPPDLPLNKLAQKLCDRRFSVGADGLIVVKAGTSGAIFAWDYINSDGSIGQMCGNGMRCFAKYVYDRGLINQTEFEVETLAGIITPSIQDDGQIKVKMGEPIVNPAQIPLALENNVFNLQAYDQNFDFMAIGMGNPHAITFLNSEQNLKDLDLEKYGKFIENHHYFPEKTNVEFAYIKNPNYINLKVWERGCGYTLACGTGACATVVAGIKKGLIDQKQITTVELPGGQLQIEWNEKDHNIYMTGPAETVFIGQVELIL